MSLCVVCPARKQPSRPPCRGLYNPAAPAHACLCWPLVSIPSSLSSPKTNCQVQAAARSGQPALRRFVGEEREVRRWRPQTRRRKTGSPLPPTQNIHVNTDRCPYACKPRTQDQRSPRLWRTSFRFAWGRPWVEIPMCQHLQPPLRRSAPPGLRPAAPQVFSHKLTRHTKRKPSAPP